MSNNPTPDEGAERGGVQVYYVSVPDKRDRWNGAECPLGIRQKAHKIRIYWRYSEKITKTGRDNARHPYSDRRGGIMVEQMSMNGHAAPYPVPAIAAQGLRKLYGEHEAVKNANL